MSQTNVTAYIKCIVDLFDDKYELTCVLCDITGVVLMEQPKVFYMGMQAIPYTLNLFDAQAFVVRDVIMGTLQLPSKEKMLEDSELWQKRLNEDKAHLLTSLTGFVHDLCCLTDYVDDTSKVDATERVKDWAQRRAHNIVNYRTFGYRSSCDGVMGLALPKPWMDMDYDWKNIEEYLEDMKKLRIACGTEK